MPPNNCTDETIVAKDAAIKTLPKWNDTPLVKKAMHKRKKKTSMDSNRNNFTKNAVNILASAQYLKALKDATSFYKAVLNGSNAGKKGYGPRLIADRWNAEVLNLPSDHKLSKSTIADAINAGQVGAPPPPIEVDHKGSPLCSPRPWLHT